MIRFRYDSKNILGKGENAGYQHFLAFPKLFTNAFYLWGRYNLGLYGKELNAIIVCICGRKEKLKTC